MGARSRSEFDMFSGWLLITYADFSKSALGNGAMFSSVLFIHPQLENCQDIVAKNI
jgi:hypothetical protein